MNPLPKSNKKQFLSLILFFSSLFSLYSQSVISSAGDYFDHPDIGNLHWTVGEIAVDYYSNTEKLNQGFHQTYTDLLISTSLGDQQLEPIEIQVYPNPTSSQVFIECNLEGKLEVELYNLLGQSLLTQSFEHNNHLIDLSNWPPAIYLLAIKQKGLIVKTFKIQKHKI